MATDVTDEHYVFVVAQLAFAHEQNEFCTLLPVLRADGMPADPADFPDAGDVWWRVPSGKQDLAQPGRLVWGSLEYSPAYVSGKARYQVKRDVDALPADEYVGVIRVPDGQLADTRQLVSGPLPEDMAQPPMPHVYVDWRDTWYGPFRTTAENAGAGKWRVRLSPVATDGGVCELTAAARKRLPAVVNVAETVSHTKTSPRTSPVTRQCQHVLMAAEPLRAATAGAPRLVLESDEAVLTKAAKRLRLLSDSKYSRLRDLLKETEAAAPWVTATEDVKRALHAVRDKLNAVVEQAGHLAEALVGSDTFRPRLDEALSRAEAEHIERNRGRLQGQIEKDLTAARAEQAAAEGTLQRLKDELAAVRHRAESKLDADLQARGAAFEDDLRRKEVAFEATRVELERQRDTLKTNLEDVAGRLGKNRDELVNQFLAISPLLGQLNLLPAGPSLPFTPPVPPPAAAARPSALPAPRPVRPTEELTEEAFFDRFMAHVAACGYTHRREDLAAFHLSVKCGDLTVLGGWPGTGKTSLARMYAAAAAGADGAGRFLHVAVSPAWLDSRDMLGSVNALDGRFQPTEAGVFEALAAAQVEHERHGVDARLTVVCLDEMNLAQVEHYFGPFLQAMEMPAADRAVKCFPAAAVAADDPYAPWATLKLPPAVRFVGTVNFDETTRPLSQRTLDRANLVRLRPPRPDAVGQADAAAPGPPVTAKHFRDWVKDGVLDPKSGAVLDDLRAPLAGLNCPLHGRRERAIQRFVASASAVCPPAQALDLQLAQRLLPQIRNLFAPGAADHLRGIKDVLAPHADKFPETLHWLRVLGAEAGGGDE